MNSERSIRYQAAQRHKKPIAALFALALVLIVFAGCFSGSPEGSMDPEPGFIDPRPVEEWEHELSQPRFDGWIHSAHRVVSLDEETELAVDLYLPDGYGDERLPAILMASPYWAVGYPKENLVDLMWPWAVDYFTERGYAVALSDMRGTRNSSGCFDFGGPGDQEDGHAVVEWLAGQQWSNGRVGMYGVSHVGMSQTAAAVTAPESLVTIVPVASITSFYRYLYHHGAHYDLNMGTPATYTAYATLPATDPDWLLSGDRVPEAACTVENNLKGVDQDGQMDDFWMERDYPSMADRIQASVFLVHGLHDDNTKTDQAHALWLALEEHDVTRKAFFGQWGHTEPPLEEEWRLIVLRWMDHWLLDNDTGIMDEPPVTVQDSTGTWRNETTWPSPLANETYTLYLAPGELVDRSGEAGSESYQDIPHMRRDQMPPGSYLTYESAPLAEDIHFTGPPRIHYDATSDVESTKWVALLYEVGPDGDDRMVTRGYMDTHQRHGLDRSDPMTPGERETHRFELFPRDYVFSEGNTLRLVVASTDRCIWQGAGPTQEYIRCGQNGIISDDTRAENTIHYGGSDPSRIEFTVFP